jgi:hypothetical protein
MTERATKMLVYIVRSYYNVRCRKQNCYTQFNKLYVSVIVNSFDTEIRAKNCSSSRDPCVAGRGRVW